MIHRALRHGKGTGCRRRGLGAQAPGRPMFMRFEIAKRPRGRKRRSHADPGPRLNRYFVEENFLKGRSVKHSAFSQISHSVKTECWYFPGEHLKHFWFCNPAAHPHRTRARPPHPAARFYRFRCYAELSTFTSRKKSASNKGLEYAPARYRIRTREPAGDETITLRSKAGNARPSRVFAPAMAPPYRHYYECSKQATTSSPATNLYGGKQQRRASSIGPERG